MPILFSIIIPCYNQAHFLSDCLDSMIAQQYPNWEAIVVNDGSTDNSTEVAKAYQEKDPRIKLIIKNNGGLSSARNEGLLHTGGDRYIFLDADDFLYSNCLSVLSKHTEINNDFTLIQYGYSYISEKKEKLLQTVFPKEKKQLIPDIFLNILAPCHSICISKKLIDISGKFDEGLKSLEDWDYWIRAAKSGAKHAIILEPLVFYRYVKNSMSRNASIMYESYKTVAQRAVCEDSRISAHSDINKDYHYDMSFTLQRGLISVLGVSIMQNKIEESILLFNKESKIEYKNYRPKDFEPMCSYLSFRYWYEKKDIEIVFSDLRPRFENFFNELGYDRAFTRQAIYFIFKRHLFIRNKNKYGSLLGSVVNFFLRKKYAA